MNPPLANTFNEQNSVLVKLKDVDGAPWCFRLRPALPGEATIFNDDDGLPMAAIAYDPESKKWRAAWSQSAGVVWDNEGTVQGTPVNLTDLALALRVLQVEAGQRTDQRDAARRDRELGSQGAAAAASAASALAAGDAVREAARARDNAASSLIQTSALTHKIPLEQIQVGPERFLLSPMLRSELGSVLARVGEHGVRIWGYWWSPRAARWVGIIERRGILSPGVDDGSTGAPAAAPAALAETLITSGTLQRWQDKIDSFRVQEQAAQAEDSADLEVAAVAGAVSRIRPDWTVRRDRGVVQVWDSKGLRVWSGKITDPAQVTLGVELAEALMVGK